jgi:hypothetical protein
MSESCCSTKKEIPASPPIERNLVVYQPIIIIFAISLVAGFAVHFGTFITFGDAVMAFFLMFLSFLKFLNLKGFVETFSQYDVLAKKTKAYAYAYPFIEFSLACLYLSCLFAMETNIIMLVIMSIGLIGIIKAIRSDNKYECACVGSGFKLPVGCVTLAENTAMGIMALMNVVMLYNL